MNGSEDDASVYSGGEGLRRREFWSQDRIIVRINQLLSESEEPLGSKAIYQRDKNLHSAILHYFRTPDGSVDWLSISLRVDASLKEKLIVPSVKRKPYTLETAIERLEEILKDHDGILTPSTICKFDPGLFKFFRKRVRGERGGVDWEKIVGFLSPDLRDRLTFREIKKRTWEGAIAELENLIIQSSKIVTPRVLEELDTALYAYLSRQVRTGKGHIDWKQVIESLKPELKARFRVQEEVAIIPIRTEEEYPSAHNEVENIMARYKDMLYSFFLTKEEITVTQRQQREELCLELIKLAQVGNPHAYSELTDWVMVLVNEWIDNNTGGVMSKYETRSGLPEKIIESCISRYRSRGDFINYIYVSLRAHALGLQENRSFDELDPKR